MCFFLTKLSLNFEFFFRIIFKKFSSNFSKMKQDTDSATNELYEIVNNLSSFVTLEFEPVGKWFEQYNYLRHQGDLAVEDLGANFLSNF